MSLEKLIIEYVNHSRLYWCHLRAIDAARYLPASAAACGFAALTDLREPVLLAWLADQPLPERNECRMAWVHFGFWCKRAGLLIENPFTDPGRRFLTPAELERLLESTRGRPLLCATQAAERLRRPRKLRPQTAQRLTIEGHERASFYAMVAATDLGLDELADLTADQLRLNDGQLSLSHEGRTVPLSGAVAADLFALLSCKFASGQWGAFRLFRLPRQLFARFGRDLVAAGLATRREVQDGLRKIIRIDKRDESCRTIDLGSLRPTRSYPDADRTAPVRFSDRRASCEPTSAL
jgi:hypothetical protein